MWQRQVRFWVVAIYLFHSIPVLGHMTLLSSGEADRLFYFLGPCFCS